VLDAFIERLWVISSSHDDDFEDQLVYVASCVKEHSEDEDKDFSTSSSSAPFSSVAPLSKKYKRLPSCSSPSIAFLR
jgi:hypothetical protein